MSRLLVIVLAALTLAACQTPEPKIITSEKSALELRSIQSRAFETTDRDKTIRNVIATLQDLGYSIDKVEPAAGTVSATKLSLLRLSAAVYPRGATQTVVRANALIRHPDARMAHLQTQVDDPRFYQQLFFEPLAKAMFLAAMQVDDSGDPPTRPPGMTPAPQSATTSK